jgi:multidrug resistance efflux pump
MEAILLGIYAFFVWLIFIKFKLLPWTTPWKVGVAILPVVALATMLLLLNIFAPTTSDVRVVKYVVPIVSQVKGRVIEVPVENNRPVKKGDVLFRIDPTPYEIEVRSLEAQLLADEAKVKAEETRLADVQTRLPDAQATERELNEQLRQATNQVAALQASLELARKRVAQNTELTAAGAGNRFDLEQAQTTTNELTAQIAAARAAEQQVREKLSGRVKGDLEAVAAAKAQIATGQAQVMVARAQADTTRQAPERPLEPGTDDRRRPKQRHDGERAAPSRLLCVRRGLQRGHDLRRQRVPDLRDVQPERTASGRCG